MFVPNYQRRKYSVYDSDVEEETDGEIDGEIDEVLEEQVEGRPKFLKSLFMMKEMYL